MVRKGISGLGNAVWGNAFYLTVFRRAQEVVRYSGLSCGERDYNRC
jgi:hypothetical protein